MYVRLTCLAAPGTTAVQELLLHPLVASETTAAVVAEAAQQLDTRQALALLRYLAAWLAHHGQLLAGWLHPVGRQRRGRGAAPRPQRGAATAGGRDGGPPSFGGGCASRYLRPLCTAFKAFAPRAFCGQEHLALLHPPRCSSYPSAGEGAGRCEPACCLESAALPSF